MGWATGHLIPNIEWYPAQADAQCSGEIDSNGKKISFTDAPCYQDRNWGFSFPPWWTWVVSNQFDHSPGTALAVGGGQPVIQGTTWIRGVSIGLRHQGKTYAWRPNDLDRVTMNINFGQWEISATKFNQSYKIEISASAPREEFLDLQFVTPHGEVFHDYETLTGEVTVKLYANTGSFLAPRFKLVETLHSSLAGIEFGSQDTYSLQKLFKQKTKLFDSSPR
jgi:hypothetical protein